MGNINIGGRLHSTATGNVVAGANEILDDVKEKKQSVINAETDAALDDRYTKDETYSKQELDSLITTPNQEYVTVEDYDSLPESGEADTIYRVANWDGSLATPAVDITKYSEYAWDGSQYVFLCVKSQIGEVFDISVYNNNAKYADLAAALNGGANIPQSLQKGGMSVKYVQSSDNKYISYMLTKNEWSTNTNNWERINLSQKLPITLYDKYGNVATDETITQQNGIYLKTDGTTDEAAALAVSDYINVSGYRGMKICYNGESGYSSTVAIIAFYDELRIFISAVSQVTTLDAVVEIPVPANAAYARFCSQKNGIDGFNCTVTWGQETIVNLANLATKTTEIDIEAMLYDKEHNVATDATITQQNGCYIRLSDGEIDYAAALATSDFINVSLLQGQAVELKYIGKSDYNDTVAIIAFYEEDKTYISGIAKRTNLSSAVLSIIPNNAYYVRVCSQKNGIDGFKLSLFGSIEGIVDYVNIKIKKLTVDTGNGAAFNKYSDNTVKFNLLNPVVESVGLSAILHDIGFIGDSLSAGEIAYKITGSDNWHYNDRYDFSWGQRLVDRITGTCTIYAIGGLSTKTWWERYIVSGNNGWSKDGGNTFASHKHSSYFIALGTNDSHIPMDVGDSTTDINYNDYNQNADTFIGNYAKIIQKIREGNSRTPIFCVIYPTAVMSRMYDDAIKEMATLFCGVYIIDLYSALQNSGAVFNYYVNGGHFTTTGYQWVSWCIGNCVNSIICNNLQYFQKQALINTSVDDGTIIW